MKKIFKNPIFTFILGVILCCVTIVIADTINSNEVLYDNSNSSSSATDVQGAIDDVYNIINHNSLSFSLLTHKPVGLSSDLIAGLYRFQGVEDTNNTVDNYICFGTTSKSDCTTNTDAYMYRIIGISSNGQLKLIKKEALNTAYVWNSSDGVDWAHSELYANLNDSYFLTNTTYVPDSSWSNRIVASDWHYATFTNANMDAATMDSTELGAETVNAKIGLMYLHDYYYGLEGGNNCSSSGAYSTCKTSWLHLSKNDTSAPNTTYEWTISRRDTSAAWYVYSDGRVPYHTMTNTNSVRPVFYLRSGERITSGSGAIGDPYILS